MQPRVSIQNVIVLGTGRMAGFLIPAFRAKGIDVVQLYGRSEKHAAALGQREKVLWTSSLDEILPGADLYILAVSDAAIPGLAVKLSALEGLVVHTSGAVPLKALAACRHHGVFYPLQTFGQMPPAELQDTPICIEGSGEEETEALTALAVRLTGRVAVLSSPKRLRLHLAAVMVNNFTNHLYALAEAFLKDNDVPFELLHPLIKRTTDLACRGKAEDLQTGPAVRGDEETILLHLNLLQDDEALAALYRSLTASIRDHRSVTSDNHEL